MKGEKIVKMNRKPKYSIDDLRKLEPDSRKTKAQLENELSNLQAEKEQLQIEFLNSIKNGYADALRPLRERQEAIDDEIIVRKENLEKNSKGYDTQDIISSWETHCMTYNESFSKKLAEYHQARKKLAESFQELAEMQRQAICDIVHCSKLIEGIDRDTTLFSADSDLLRPKTLDVYEKKENRLTIDCSNRIPNCYQDSVVIEELYISAFAASGDLSKEKIDKLILILCNGRSKEKDQSSIFSVKEGTAIPFLLSR